MYFSLKNYELKQSTGSKTCPCCERCYVSGAEETCPYCGTEYGIQEDDKVGIALVH